jgi:hypothetical protein
LEAVDYFTTAQCSSNGESCKSETAKEHCISNGGKCEIQSDGYYFVAAASFVIGVILFIRLIQPSVRMLESLPRVSWKLSNTFPG